ncbi:MAG: UbiD family decarboxylase [Clostridia bacterium]|nr:UbiD family decarboxylase [Clostridia bacterium]
MVKDLRDYIDFIEQKGDLRRVTEETKILEIPTLMKQAEKDGKMLLVENVQGYKYRFINNIFGKRDFMAGILGCEIRDVMKVFSERSNNFIKPVMVEDGPVQELVFKGEDVDILQFPFIVHKQKDAGRYITAGMVIAKDPETGCRNLSFARMQLKGKNKTGLRMSPTQDLEAYYKKAVALNQPLEIAVVIGAHPMILAAAACGPARDVDELDIAGGFLGKPIELVKCKTVDIEVPADAELVLEGKIMPGELEPEGPFGDFMEFYIPVFPNNIFHIDCITMRPDPIIQGISAGSIDDVTLLGTTREAQLYAALKSINIDVKAINCMLTGNYLSAAIAIHKQYELECKNALMMAFATFKFLKNCYIVDEDVDVFNPSDIFWAMSTRMRPETGIMTVPNSMGFGRDTYGIHTCKMGIDATAPFNHWDEFERVQIPDPNEDRHYDFV